MSVNLRKYISCHCM